VDKALEPASGEVTVELFQGQARAVARSSPQSLYRPDLASFDMTGYDARHAQGFIRLFGLPLATAARRDAEGRTAPAGPGQAALRGEERSERAARSSSPRAPAPRAGTALEVRPRRKSRGR
jgi:hypothetical protein